MWVSVAAETTHISALEMQVDDVYCPACRLVLYRRGASDVAPRHCPRCIARRRRLVTMIALDRPTDVGPERLSGSDVVKPER